MINDLKETQNSKQLSLNYVRVIFRSEYFAPEMSNGTPRIQHLEILLLFIISIICVMAC